jgi:hypothetical protein
MKSNAFKLNKLWLNFQEEGFEKLHSKRIAKKVQVFLYKITIICEMAALLSLFIIGMIHDYQCFMNYVNIILFAISFIAIVLQFKKNRKARETIFKSLFFIYFLSTLFIISVEIAITIKHQLSQKAFIIMLKY